VSAAWISSVISLLGITWILIQIGSHFDKEDDPKTKERRKQLGEWLSGLGAHTLETRLQETNQTFFFLFDRLFGAKKSVIEQGIWAGLLVSPVILAGLRIAGGFFEEDSTDLLLFAILIAFSVSLGVIIGRSLIAHGYSIVVGIVLSLSFILGMVLGTGIVLTPEIVLGIAVGIVGVVGIIIALIHVLGIGGWSSRWGLPGMVLGIAMLVTVGVFFAISRTTHLSSGIGSVSSAEVSGIILIGLVSGPLLGIGIGRAPKFVQGVLHIPIHPLKALGSSLVFIVGVSLAASLTRVDAATTFFAEMRNGEGFKILAFVAFNIFADGVSLLETWWVLQRGRRTTVVQLLGLLALDLAASGAIFLILPAVVGEITAIYDAILFHGDRPWLGILFWSTFGTSVIFYLFVIAVFSFLLPGHALATGFRKVIGSFSNIEERPFTSIAYALSALCLLFAVATGVTVLINS
jgi:hypothetical protein